VESFCVTTINLCCSPTNVIPRSSNIISYHSVRGLGVSRVNMAFKGIHNGESEHSMGYNNMCLGFYCARTPPPPIHFTGITLLQKASSFYMSTFSFFKSTVEWKTVPSTVIWPDSVTGLSLWTITELAQANKWDIHMKAHT
jgi:hypothetical protein